MKDTYVPIKKVVDYAIEVLKYFAICSSAMLISIIGCILAWIFENTIGMIVSILVLIVSSICIALGLYVLYLQKRESR